MEPGTRTRHRRTKAGCLTCRARKKKCDEAKPRCAGCRRNMLVCDWPPPATQSVDQDGGASTSSLDGCRAEAMPRRGMVQRLPDLRLPVTSPKMSIPPSVPSYHVGSERACGLTPQSVLLLEHYLKETAALFAMAPFKDNPFVTVLLPLGYVDNLLMHGLLAFSGAHLTYKKPDNIELANTTTLHYSRLLSGLRTEFSILEEDDLEKKERLLRVLVVACHHQAVAGDTKGFIFNHLRASRHLILSLLAETTADHIWRPFNIDALGFSMELYSYLVFCNFLTPYGLIEDRTLPLDPFLLSLEKIGTFPTFGSLYAGSHELFLLVPEIGLLGARRLREEAAGSLQPSATTKSIHDDILNRITNWDMPPPGTKESTADWEHRRRAAETFRQGLHIYLATALAGSTVRDRSVLEAIRAHVIKLFANVPKIVESQYVGTVLWPIVMGGSCIVKAEHQQALAQELRSSPSSMKHLQIVADTLQLLWDDPDPRAFGPYGLYLVMEKHGLSIGIA